MAHHTGNVGAPQKYSPKQIAEIVEDLDNYIKGNADPTIVGFTSGYTKYSINKDYISDHQEFSELRKKAIEKQENYLLYGATLNKLNPTVSIFRLKQPQHGYTDRQDIKQEISGQLDTGIQDPELAANFAEYLKNLE